MALICGTCGSDLVQTCLDSRAKCLDCGTWLDQNTRAPEPAGLKWTSEVPDQTLATAARTVEG